MPIGGHLTCCQKPVLTLDARAGPFREATGKASPFLAPKYMRGVVTLGGLVPVCAMAYLAWQGQATLGFCTLGVYVMQLFAQIKAEGVYLRKGVTKHLAGLQFSS